ncbi:MAG: glycosyltransferase family 9 protein [Negativicutes bacterium]|jgi:3-deoxy-D-manno-octulosonic-acid transferase
MLKFDKVLLISRWKTLGDSAVATVIAKELKRLNPTCVVDAYVPYSVADIWQMSPYIDKVYIHSKDRGLKKFFHECGMFMKFWRTRYDLAVAVAKSPTVVMAFLSMAKRKTGNTMSRMGKNFFSNAIDKYAIEDRTTNIIKHYLYSLARLGLPVDFSTSADLVAPEGVFQPLKKRLKLPENYAVVCMSGSTYASGPHRNIPGEKFSPIIKALKMKYGAVYAIGAAAQKDYIDSLCSDYSNDIINISGQLNMNEMAALLSECKQFVTIDTGPMHIADALGTPTIALFGFDKDHLSRCMPQGKNTKVIKAYKPSERGIDNEHIDVEEVVKLI